MADNHDDLKHIKEKIETNLDGLLRFNRASWVSTHLGEGHYWLDQRTAFAVPFIR
jgi:hypothetical protein